MSLTLKTLVLDGVGTEAKMLTADTQDDFKLLQELTRRGVENWPDAPNEIKTLALIVSGAFPGSATKIADKPQGEKK